MPSRLRALLTTPHPSLKLRAGLLFLYTVLIAVRMPQILLKGRFWAEEGVVYFRNGHNLPWYDALFAIHTGYLNLAASFATLLAARLVPIEQAPWVSTGFALLIQLCPALLLLTSEVAWLRGPWATITALLLLLATMPSGEVWMNSITSQFHLGLCTALILAWPLRDGGHRMFRNALLLLAALSGLVSAFLAPLFVVRGFLEGSWQRLWQGAVLGCGGAVQLAMILAYPEPARAIGIGPRLLTLVIYVKQILLPLVGTTATEALTQDLQGQVLSGKTPWFPLMLSTACVAAMVWAAWRSRNAEVRWLLAGGAVILALSYFGALGPHIQLLGATFGDRYSYAPTALFSLALFGIARTAGGWLSAVTAVLVCMLMATGAYGYFSPGDMFRDGSSWRAEIARWRIDPSYWVEFWPNLRWPIGR